QELMQIPQPVHLSKSTMGKSFMSLKGSIAPSLQDMAQGSQGIF
ncbi:unnamed protein product, partial [marine sediment metagenome]